MVHVCDLLEEIKRVQSVTEKQSKRQMGRTCKKHAFVHPSVSKQEYVYSVCCFSALTFHSMQPKKYKLPLQTGANVEYRYPHLMRQR